MSDPAGSDQPAFLHTRSKLDALLDEIDAKQELREFPEIRHAVSEAAALIERQIDHWYKHVGRSGDREKKPPT